ncbi:MAG: ATP synthase F1 subunit gamma [Coriobacteriales bacterium]|jgi:F-type H+-transporting ATPase subunit gamma|nr:ATP synthase F1 subunit gamma [Coriobacteriales bacterium]
MANLRDIKKRIASVNSTKQITRTMEMVATAKIRRATDRIVDAIPYAMAILEVLEAVAQKSVGTDSPLLQTHADLKRILVIAVVSDRGLAGGFNANVLRATDAFITKNKAKGIECDIIVCGKKGLSYFNYRKMPVVLSFRDQSADPKIAQAREIASYIIDAYISNKVDQVVIFYNHAKNVADQITLSEQVLPVDHYAFTEVVADEDDIVHLDESAKAASAYQRVLTEARESAAELITTEEISGDFDYEPSAQTVLESLVPSFVETRVFHALLDSAAGEQGARRKAMKAATDNANEMVTTLTRIYNRARQGAITTEITEIVGGAAALEEE